MKKISKSIEISGKTLTFTTGELAQQATSSVMARMGDTIVLATIVMGKVNTTLDYFPLSVDYVERLYAGGIIKGSRWVKREGRPTDDAILTARLIDRSIRPLFPKEFKREVQVIVTLLSTDGENAPDILAINAVSAALAVSKIPWGGPIGSSRVGAVSEDTGLVVNPKASEQKALHLDMVVSSTKEKVHMLEAGARQASEKIARESIIEAKKVNKEIIATIEEMVKEVGEEKVAVEKDEAYLSVVALIEKSYKDEILKVIDEGVTKEVGGALNELIKRVEELENKNKDKEDKVETSVIAKAVDYVFKKAIRELIMTKGQRPDKRKVTEVRPLDIQAGVLPRVHGSAIFARGETQVLSVATLGTPSLAQLIENPDGEQEKHYMHHYSFPAYSVGETGRVGSPNRREIGHGALAERALEPVIPAQSDFPYAIRVVSEVMSSNGSTSQASICGSTLALMDAGVPILAPVAGIAMGLMTKEDKYVILTDIMGLEDFSGDMDFKVAGTKTGITAIQLDVKLDGLTDQMVDETLQGALDARLFILEKMAAVIAEPRKAVSSFAPKIKSIKINPEKIGEVIGSGGRVIKNIIATTGATVDVEDDGTVTMSSTSEEAVNKAIEWVEILSRELQRGEVFEGKVVRMMPFGAFVEIVPGKDGLVHVSEMDTEYVKDPNDIVKVGQVVKVRVKEVDDQGRINLSMVFGERAEGSKDDRVENPRPERSSAPRGGERRERPGGDRGSDRGPRKRHH
jgi:polyribonucleotide nucleotidyltransferase